MLVVKHFNSFKASANYNTFKPFFTNRFHTTLVVHWTFKLQSTGSNPSAIGEIALFVLNW